MDMKCFTRHRLIQSVRKKVQVQQNTNTKDQKRSFTFIEDYIDKKVMCN